jgi:beta-lactamase class A
MRERNKPFGKKRTPRPPDAAGSRRADGGASSKPPEARTANRSARSGDRQSTASRRSERQRGGFWSLFGNLFSGGQDNRRQRRNRAASAANVAVHRLVDLQQHRSEPGHLTDRSGAVLPIAKAAAPARQRPGRDRRQALRQSHQPAGRPQHLINLPNPRSQSGKLILHGLRLLIFGVGIGVLAGTLISAWDPASNLSAGAAAGKEAVVAPAHPTDDFKLGQEMTQLKTQLLAVTAQNKQMKPGVLLLDLDTNAFVDINASDAFPAASTIKFPILVAFFQEVDAGKIQLAEPLTMKKEQVATESGDMQYQPTGTQFSAIETATNMMVVSDNTATNMLIERLGGMGGLNQRFQSWGLSATMARNSLPDVQAQNTTSPKDLAKLMSQVQSGKLVSMKSRDRILEIMHHVENDSLLPKGLGNGATIAHKTGTLSVLLGDIGLIDAPNGKRYLASVLVQRPRDDVRAEEMIQQISRLSYQAFTQPQSAQTVDRPRIAQP